MTTAARAAIDAHGQRRAAAHLDRALPLANMSRDPDAELRAWHNDVGDGGGRPAASTFRVLDTSRPFSMMSGDGDHAHTGIGLEVPKVPLPPARHHMAALSPPCTSPSRRGEDLTLAAWIRHQRLERARRYLTDLTMRHETIDELAA
ncbi:hypothetical protein OG528_36835 [Streptomyces platensis]|uniref:hypothetical protein n=1 Tax=Streptomyces platensis TaxID=58346 RepID=UPI0030E01756